MKKQAGYPCDKEQPKTSHLSNRSKFASSFFNSYSECIMRTLCTHSCPLFQDIPSWPPLHPQKQNNPHFFIAVRIILFYPFPQINEKNLPLPARCVAGLVVYTLAKAAVRFFGLLPPSLRAQCCHERTMLHLA